MSSVHGILFNAHIIYSFALGIWATSMAARNESISGNFWGAVATYVILVAVTTLVSIVMALQGLQPRSSRMTVYFLYMAFLLVIMPGLFSLLRGRDDRSRNRNRPGRGGGPVHLATVQWGIGRPDSELARANRFT